MPSLALIPLATTAALLAFATAKASVVLPGSVFLLSVNAGDRTSTSAGTIGELRVTFASDPIITAEQATAIEEPSPDVNTFTFSIVPFKPAETSSYLAYSFAVIGPDELSIPATLSYTMGYNAVYRSTPYSTSDGFPPQGFTASNELFAGLNGADYQRTLFYGGSSNTTTAGYEPFNGYDNGAMIDTTSNDLSCVITETVPILLRSNVVEGIALDTHVTGDFGLVQSWIGPVILSVNGPFSRSTPGYSIEFSPGIGNSVSAVPEPNGWATLLLGLFASGVVVRGKRRAVGVVAST